jgi:lambda family phage portal protein
MDVDTLRPSAYWMRTTPGYATLIGPTGPLVRIPANKIIHGYTQEDEDQPRGVPWSHASLVKLKMLDEYDRAELTAARDEACSVREYTADKDADPEGFKDLTKEENSEAANALVAQKEPGQAEIVPMGYKSTVQTPQHPNREVTAFKASMLKDISSGLGVEYSNFCNDWSGVSFSSVRAGTISERDIYMVLQDTMISQCKARMFLIWLRSFLRMPISDPLPLAKVDKFSEHEFRGRRWMWVDPMKDMKAAEVCVAHGWKTNTQIAADLGTDYEDNMETMKREKEVSKGVIPDPMTQPAQGGAQPVTPAKMQEDEEQDDDEDTNGKPAGK